ncbi:hypothetical protein [Klebsiella quasivariicola]|uniref:hypothetical protein n=1 Tax=Klebsiella quasivariicola TaxID=2026240 RepID=UPI00247B1738|nr:hypothetical protein [Klebsiella quasivariicola]
MYSTKIKEAIEAANSQYASLMNKATNTTEAKHPEEEAMKNKWLLAEGFKPVITPEKEIKWIPKTKQPTEAIQNYQKGMNSMSNETLVQAYPFLQYAIKNYIPVMEQLIKGVQSGDLSQQYLNEMIAKLAIEGIEEAINKTGGMSKQGQMQLAKASSAEQSAQLINSSSTAIKQVGGE